MDIMTTTPQEVLDSTLRLPRGYYLAFVSIKAPYLQLLKGIVWKNPPPAPPKRGIFLPVSWWEALCEGECLIWQCASQTELTRMGWIHYLYYSVPPWPRCQTFLNSFHMQAITKKHPKKTSSLPSWLKSPDCFSSTHRLTRLNLSWFLALLKACAC